MYTYIDLSIDVDNVVRFFFIVRFGTLAAILSNRWPAFSILVSLPTNKQTNYELKNIYVHTAEMNIFIDNTL